MKRIDDQQGFGHLLLLVAVLVIAVTGASGYLVYKNTQKNFAKPTSTGDDTAVKVKTLGEVKADPAPTTADNLKTPDTETKPSTTPTPKATPTQTAPVAEQPKTTGCMPANRDHTYDSSYTSSTSALLADNWYASTKKFSDAIVFAGLTSTVNSDKYTTFAVADGVWDKLTTAQLAYLNSSPDHMREMLNWQIVSSCVSYTYTLQNLTAPTTVTTLAGPINLDADYHGHLGTTDGAIWDFFTKNGNVNLMVDLVKPPAL